MNLYRMPGPPVVAPGSLPLEVHLESQGLWRQATCENFLELDCTASPQLPFHFSALLARFSNCLVAELCVSESQVVRRKAIAENSDEAHFKILWQLSGKGRIRQGRHDSTLRAGQWTIYDTTREYVYECAERSRFMVLFVPQDESMGWTSAVANLCGQAAPGGGAAHIVLSALGGMLRDGTPLDDDSQRTLQDSTIALLERALQGRYRDLEGDIASPGSEQKLQRVRAYILDHLSDIQLTPERVALAFGMSRRSLYNLFLQAGETPRAHIQQVRLDRSARLLENPASRDLALMQIARATGFRDQSHFSRAFAARFGMAPSLWRDSRAARDHAPRS